MNRTRSSSPYPPLRPGVVAARLVGGGLLLALALCLVGWGIVRLPSSSGLAAWEHGVNAALADARTPTMNTLSHLGSSMADTVTCIALLVVMVVVLRVWLGRWRESWTLVAAIVGELLVFLVVTALVDRPRPAVPHLDAAPPTSSFPSGHTGAAMALYGCLAVIVLRQLNHRRVAVAVAAVCFAVPVVVAAARLYRGMHHPTDVLFGAVGGGLWLLLVLVTLLPRPRDDDEGPDAVAAPSGRRERPVTDVRTTTGVLRSAE
jgi:undecaprenyl-diphosphatase